MKKNTENTQENEQDVKETAAAPENKKTKKGVRF